MDKFYIIVLSIFAFFLILILTIIGRTVVSENSKQQFPPVLSKCPDYWDVSGELCLNTTKSTIQAGINGLEYSKCPSSTSTPYYADTSCNIKPADASWTTINLTSTCGKKKWAFANNIMWDGVSNYNSC